MNRVLLLSTVLTLMVNPTFGQYGAFSSDKNLLTSNMMPIYRMYDRQMHPHKYAVPYSMFNDNEKEAHAHSHSPSSVVVVAQERKGNASPYHPSRRPSAHPDHIDDRGQQFTIDHHTMENHRMISIQMPNAYHHQSYPLHETFVSRMKSSAHPTTRAPLTSRTAKKLFGGTENKHSDFHNFVSNSVSNFPQTHSPHEPAPHRGTGYQKPFVVHHNNLMKHPESTLEPVSKFKLSRPATITNYNNYVSPYSVSKNFYNIKGHESHLTRHPSTYSNNEIYTPTFKEVRQPYGNHFGGEKHEMVEIGGAMDVHDHNMDFDNDPEYMGAFYNVDTEHGVTGHLFKLNDNTLYIQGFSFDGSAPDAYFWADGVAIPFYTRSEPHKILQQVGSYHNEDIVLMLPPTKPTIHSLKHFALWCRMFDVTFAEWKLPMSHLNPYHL